MHKTDLINYRKILRILLVLLIYILFNKLYDNFTPPRMRLGKLMRSVATVSVSVCNALTFESLELESSFLVHLEYLGQDHIKVIGWKWRSQEQQSVSSCPVWALNFECLDLQRYFLVCRYTSAYLGPVPISRSSGEGQGHRGKKTVSVCRSRVVCLRLEGNVVSRCPFLLF